MSSPRSQETAFKLQGGPPLSAGIMSGARVLPKAELEERVRRAAAGLAGLGVEADSKVALLMRNEIAFVEVSLAAQWLGAHAVPINWHLKPDEVAYILADSGAKVLVAHTDLLQPLAGVIPDGVSCFAVDPPPEIMSVYRINPADCIPPDNVVSWNEFVAQQRTASGEQTFATGTSIIYTSGTTGRPKGVTRLPARPDQKINAEALRRKVYGLRPNMRTAIVAPMYHFAPNSVALICARLAELLVLLPRFGPEELLALVERERLTQLWLVPTMFIRLLKLPEAVRQSYDLSSLEFIIHAGAPCPPDVKEKMIAWLGPIINELYGSTESGPVAFCDSEEWSAHRGSVGRLTEGTRVEIVDDHGKELPLGVPGEIFVKVGDYPDFTYHNNVEKRAEVARGDLITCGDVGYLDADNFLYLCDRKRDMVIIGGVNVYPAEIESVICSLDHVKDCAVFGIPDDEYGEALMALIQPIEGSTLDAGDLAATLRSRLASYKVPRSLKIVDDLPREDSGKIFKRLLREPYWHGRERNI